MESNICQIVEEAVIIETYPKAELSIVVHILESDG
jgi:ribonuclease PH